MSEPISSTCLCSEPYQVPSLRPLIAQLNIFIHTHKIHTVGVYPRLNRTCDIACTLIIGVYPNVWLINLPPPDHCLKTNTSSRFLTHIQLSLARRRYDYLHKDMVLSPSGRTPSRSALISISGLQSYTATAVAPYPPHVQSWRIRSCNTGS